MTTATLAEGANARHSRSRTIDAPALHRSQKGGRVCQPGVHPEASTDKQGKTTARKLNRKDRKGNTGRDKQVGQRGEIFFVFFFFVLSGFFFFVLFCFCFLGIGGPTYLSEDGVKRLLRQLGSLTPVDLMVTTGSGRSKGLTTEGSGVPGGGGM